MESILEQTDFQNLASLKTLELDDSKSSVPAINTLLANLKEESKIISLTKLKLNHTFKGHDPFDQLSDFVKEGRFPNLREVDILSSFPHTNLEYFSIVAAPDLHCFSVEYKKLQLGAFGHPALQVQQPS